MNSEDIGPEFHTLQKAVAGRFSIERELGRGGMGLVFLARDVALERRVAIKLLAPHLAADPDARRQFVREARTAASLSHPNVVPIHLVEEHGELVFFVMTFVEGETLRQRVERRGTLSSPDGVRFIQEVAWALTMAHEKGIVHRDVKPDNILLEKSSGRAMVTDFGIAQVARAGASTEGEVVGTAHFMSPEQAMGESLDGRSDLYSLGVTAFYALTGSLPFDAPNVPAILAKHLTQPAPALTSLRADATGALATLVARSLAKDREARFQSAKELTDFIEAAKLGEAAIPVSIRLFQATAHSLGAEFTAYTLVIWLLGVPSTNTAVIAWSDAVTQMFMTGTLALIWAVRSRKLVSLARTVLAEGFEFDDVRRAFEREPPGETTEQKARGEKAKRWYSKRLFSVGACKIPELALAGAPFVIAGSLLSAQFTFTRVPSGGFQMSTAPLWARGVLYVGAAALAASFLLPVPRSRKAQTTPRSFWSTIWSGPIGRWFFRHVGPLPRHARPTPGSAEPTATMIAGAADAVLRDLPEAHRQRLLDVPNVIDRLRAHAETLRARRADVAEVLARHGASLDPGANAQLAAAADEISKRYATAVAALENLRLDLIRLRSNEVSIESLTANLRAAERIGAESDRLVEADASVNALLRTYRGPTS